MLAIILLEFVEAPYGSFQIINAQRILYIVQGDSRGLWETTDLC